MNKLKKNDPVKARKLCNIFRFVDDLICINDDGEFKNSYFSIYPGELNLDKKSVDKNEASVLGIDIKTKDKKFHFNLFGKRDSFRFSIVRMLDKSSNVPSS